MTLILSCALYDEFILCRNIINHCLSWCLLLYWFCKNPPWLIQLTLINWFSFNFCYPWASASYSFFNCFYVFHNVEIHKIWLAMSNINLMTSIISWELCLWTWPWHVWFLSRLSVVGGPAYYEYIFWFLHILDNIYYVVSFIWQLSKHCCSQSSV